MFAMVVDDMTTMGDAIAIVDCCLLAIFLPAAREAEKVVLFCKKGAANKLLLCYLLDSIRPEMRRLMTRY